MEMNKISVVVPVYNEAESLAELTAEIVSSVGELGLDYEIIFVNDGSSDESWARIRSLCENGDARVRGIRFRRNFGKAAALSAGFKAARGDVVFTMDADLQDDPAEIPAFLGKLEEGYDLVSGWKENRRDPISKTLPSRLFNAVTRAISGIPLHDFNCGFKAYRKEVTANINLYGELHRYIPVLAFDLGYRIGEIPVRHHPRKHGRSKYGFMRVFAGFLDLLTVIATTRYLRRPAHLFGGIGIALLGSGILILLYLTGLWFTGDRPIGNRPLFFLGILNTIVAVNFLSFGLLAEIINRKILPEDTHIQIAEVIDTEAGEDPS